MQTGFLIVVRSPNFFLILSLRDIRETVKCEVTEYHISVVMTGLFRCRHAVLTSHWEGNYVYHLCNSVYCGDGAVGRSFSLMDLWEIVGYTNKSSFSEVAFTRPQNTS